MAGHAAVEHGGDKRIALLIAILALCLAIAETGAKSAQTNALGSNVEAANLWAFFQARTIRQTIVRTEAESVALLPGADAEAVAKQVAAWRATAARWESEPDTGEGRRELMARAKAAESKRDKSLHAYHLFEYGSAAFQVAIVVASASIITGVPALALGGVVLGLAGVALSALGAFAPEAVHL